jgi:ectoine hydroxylase-related dioxygenase (phytanoyl-CoA dioxygenase family)
MALSQSEIDSWQSEGYLIVEGVLGPEQLAGYRESISKLVAESALLTQSNERFDLEVNHELGASRVGRIKAPHKFYPELWALVRDPALLDILKPLIGPNIRLYDSKMNLKPPGGGAPVEWHQDWAFYPHTNQDMLAAGVYFDDISEENGTLLVIPGSHRGPLYEHHIEGVFSGAIDRRRCDVDFSSAVPLTAKAGSVSVHHTRLIHGSGPNYSRKPRWLLLIEFTAADAWPLMGLPEDLDEFDARIVTGVPTLSPRMEAVPVRIPLPEISGPQRETVYQYHRALPDRYFDWPTG